jgi:hypothetical protein
MARRNRTRFIRGSEILTASDAYWDASQVVAYAQALKHHDPAMVVALYPTDFREALKAALEAVGLRWRCVDSEEMRMICSTAQA